MQLDAVATTTDWAQRYAERGHEARVQRIMRRVGCCGAGRGPPAGGTGCVHDLRKVDALVARLTNRGCATRRQRCGGAGPTQRLGFCTPRSVGKERLAQGPRQAELAHTDELVGAGQSPSLSYSDALTRIAQVCFPPPCASGWRVLRASRSTNCGRTIPAPAPVSDGPERRRVRSQRRNRGYSAGRAQACV